MVIKVVATGFFFSTPFQQREMRCEVGAMSSVKSSWAVGLVVDKDEITASLQKKM